MPARRKARSEVGKPGRLDDVRLDAEAGGEPENRAGVLGDIGLVEGDPHGARFGRAPRARQWPKHADGQRICATLGHSRAGGLALSLARVPINAAGSPPFVLPQGLERPARPPPRLSRARAVSPRGRADRLTRDLKTVTTIFGRADTPRFPLHRDRRRRRGRRARRSLVPLIAQMNPDASTIAAGAPIEVDLGADRRRPGHQGVLARQADLHQPPHQERDRGGARTSIWRACPIRSPTARASRPARTSGRC